MQAIYFYALNDSFVTKHISLANGQRVKVGRQTNNKTIPAERNGYFDSKVLSRQHAEVWEEGGKIFIRDVKSSNGTFINGDRLSAEGAESDPFPLNSDDIVEFGIDIVGEDNKTIIHHKVAARVFCVLNQQDADLAARNEAQSQASSSPHPSGSRLSTQGNGSSFNFVPNDQQGPNGQRRGPMQQQQQGLGGMGGMGGNMRQPGKSGLTFDLVYSRLQGEVQKAKDHNTDLQGFESALGDITNTLGGALPPNMAFPQILPPVRAPQAQIEAPPPAPNAEASGSSEVQNQIHDALSILDTHSSKLLEVDTVRLQQSELKRELDALRDQVQKQRRDAEQQSLDDGHNSNGDNDYDFNRESEFESDGEDDDNSSVHTILPHELERVDEEDEDALAAEDSSHQEDLDIPSEDSDDRRRRRADFARPRTPEPNAMGMSEEEYEPRRGKLLAARRATSPQASHSTIDQLNERLTALSSQLEMALSMSSSLQAQHDAAQSTISALEGKVLKLEDLVQVVSVASAASASSEPEVSQAAQHESLTALLSEWKKGVEGQWGTVQEDWGVERERLGRAREEWESRAKATEGRIETVEASLAGAQATIASVEQRVGSIEGSVQDVQGSVRSVEVVNKTLETDAQSVGEQVKSVQSSLEEAVTRIDAGLATIAATASRLLNGNVTSRSGLVTPPSPRSFSSDSNRPRRHRRSASSSSRGRSHSRSREVDQGETSSTGTSATSGSILFASNHTRPDSPSTSLPDESSDETAVGKRTDAAHTLATPESSASQVKTNDATRKRLTDEQLRGLSTAVGVSVLFIAAAAVAWRVKPE